MTTGFCDWTRDRRRRPALADQLRVVPLSGEAGLSLHFVRIPTVVERLAWLAQWIPRLAGSGIVYCLTVADTARVADWLNANGITAAAYSGETDSERRLEIERQLKSNELKVVAATSALGMGFDKPDLAFVIHFQSPDSPVACYQQVGRAGRAVDDAEVVLLWSERAAERRTCRGGSDAHSALDA